MGGGGGTVTFGSVGMKVSVALHQEESSHAQCSSKNSCFVSFTSRSDSNNH